MRSCDSAARPWSRRAESEAKEYDRRAAAWAGETSVPCVHLGRERARTVLLDEVDLLQPPDSLDGPEKESGCWARVRAGESSVPSVQLMCDGVRTSFSTSIRRCGVPIKMLDEDSCRKLMSSS